MEGFFKESVLIKSLGISIITSIGLLFLIIIFSLIPSNIFGEWSILINLSLPTFLALYLFPKIFENYIAKQSQTIDFKLRKYWKQIVFFTIFTVFYLLNFANQYESLIGIVILIIHCLIVSLGEEYVYRYLIIKVLRKKYGIFLSIIISALMFAFILHNNESFINNLLIRFPFGILLGMITVKTNSISMPIVVHTIYNLIIITI